MGANHLFEITAMEDRKGSVEGKHVLVVDDDIELALTYQALLQAHDYQASTAANGAEALKLVRNGKVDAILCDLDMPELSGDLFYIEVGRAWPQLLRRFIFVTGNAQNPTYENFLKSVPVPVLPKPVSIDRLLDTLQTVLGTASRPSTPS
jgi:two-component system, cell cycle sensor histidine kinase and response regulator CckA